MSSILNTLAAVSAAAILVAGCAVASSPESEEEGALGSDSAALTAEQCDYFDVNGSIQICHQLGNGKFKILRLNEQACVNAHGTHATDYVTSTDPNSPLYDPSCQGLGCLPQAAPCDATLPCCDGLTCKDGTCQLASACPCFMQHPDIWAWVQSQVAQGTSCFQNPYYVGVDMDPMFPANASIQFTYCHIQDWNDSYSLVDLTPEEATACAAEITAICWPQ